MFRIRDNFIAAAAIGVAFGASSAMAAPILSNPILSSGGNTFDSFACSATAVGGATPGSCDAIDVFSPGSFGAGNLEINADFSASGVGSSSDTRILYHVHSATGITAIDLHFDANFLDSGRGTITEAVFSDAARTQEVGFLAVNCFAGACTFADRNDPPFEEPPVGADIPLTGTFTDLWIRKDIAASSTTTGGLAAFSIVGQTFETTPVPEPTSLALIGSALFGFGWLARRRRQV